jgi:hypothetical protein
LVFRAQQVNTIAARTVSPHAGACSNVMRCLADPQCKQCLNTINSTVGFPHSVVEYIGLDNAAYRAYEIKFFQTLQSTASCSTNHGSNMTLLMRNALDELAYDNSCINSQSMAADPCLAAEYACFSTSDHCRECLGSLYAAVNGTSNVTKANAALSSACNATDHNATDQIRITGVVSFCAGTFPTCTYVKQRCALEPECNACLTKVMRGNGSGAALDCPLKSLVDPFHVPGYALSVVVDSCVASDPVACDFWLQRCADNITCANCLADIGNGDSARAIAADLSTPRCRKALSNKNLANLYLDSITFSCPKISTCRGAVTSCVRIYGDDCIACINGSAPAKQASFCSELSQEFGYDAKCAPCPASVHTINVVVVATSAVGGASASACIAVATTIVAHGRDRVSMRDRIVVGLMLTNAVYSTANAIPLNALRTGVIDCGRLAMSFDVIRLGRALWFCGKYGLVCFELLILGASIRALHRGVSGVPARAEAAMHATCFAAAVCAFAVFYTLCARINAKGYNAKTEAYTNAYNHAKADDDHDDEAPSGQASSAFQGSRNAYDNLVGNMLLAWDLVVCLAVGLWIVLRVSYVLAQRALRTEAAAAAAAEASDEWRATRRSAWEARRRLFEARGEAFMEVVKPLEPYIFVFVLFAAPAFVMSTDTCQRHSGEYSDGGGTNADGGLGGGSTNFSYGTCYAWCEFILAFRSPGSVAVYLASRERRYELLAVCTTLRKLCTRVFGCIRCTTTSPVSYTRFDNDHHNNNDASHTEHQHVDGTNAGPTINTYAPSDPSVYRIDEHDVVKEHVLGA